MGDIAGQGDLVLCALEASGNVAPLSPGGAVQALCVLNQTCDIAHSKGRLLVAHVTEIDQKIAAQARQYAMPRYLPVDPDLGLAADLFVDLDTMTNLSPSQLAGYQVRSSTTRWAKLVQTALVRKFSRIALPDDVVRVLKPLTDALRSKARGEKSSVGKVFKQVHSVRVGPVDCGDEGVDTWSRGVNVFLLVEPKYLPDLPAHNDGEVHSSFVQMIDVRRKPLDGLSLACDLLLKTPDGSSKVYAWGRFTEFLANACNAEAVAKKLSIEVEVFAESMDDFSYSRYLETEALDLDYLSWNLE